eukprot:TRINITY_DN30426_c0_g1_i1.p1 TRINITY_DN30426_c0_g1~~TRINITY_DN30426_c0_g1_i1.p1  ORF type:complete len:464 (-),score=70.40 TRINITY_DN30426_c0_g1_i1:798-2189(-)
MVLIVDGPAQPGRRALLGLLMASPLLLVAVVWLAMPGGQRGPLHAEMAATVQTWDLDGSLKQAASDFLHKAANTAVKIGIEGAQEGAPAAIINETFASAQHLVEELLSDKELTKEIRIKPVEGGMIEAGRLYALRMVTASVGPGTHLAFDEQNDEVKFVVMNLSVNVRTKFDLRLTQMAFGESGDVQARLFGSGMTLRFPQEGTGRGGCDFGGGLDLEVQDATSTQSELNVAILQIMRSNLMGIRTEVVRGMEDGLCQALLDDDEMSVQLGGGPAPYQNKTMDESSSLVPLVLAGLILLALCSLGVCFCLGRYSALKDLSSLKRSRGVTFESRSDEEDGGSSDSESVRSECGDSKAIVSTTAPGSTQSSMTTSSEAALLHAPAARPRIQSVVIVQDGTQSVVAPRSGTQSVVATMNPKASICIPAPSPIVSVATPPPQLGSDGTIVLSAPKLRTLAPGGYTFK